MLSIIIVFEKIKLVKQVFNFYFYEGNSGDILVGDPWHDFSPKFRSLSSILIESYLYWPRINPLFLLINLNKSVFNYSLYITLLFFGRFSFVHHSLV